MSLDYNLLKTFISVAELGSFTQAAKALSQPKSRVSRSIARLERELGVELIRRTTRKTTLTITGQDFYQKITPHLKEVANELIRVSEKQDEMEGVIRITTADTFAQNSIAEIISKFNIKYPKVRFEMIITNEYVDLVKENIDLAFRAGKLEDSTLIQKKFMSSNFILVCSKNYSQKCSLPESLLDLKDHNFLSFTPFENIFTKKKIKLNSIVTTDSLPMLLKMALSGSGIAILPDFLCEKYLQDERLVRVVPSWKTKTENVHILYPPTKNQPKRVKEFILAARDFYQK